MKNSSYTGHLVLCKKRNSTKLSARLAKNYPALNSDEIAVSISVKVPSALFDKPQLSAEIEVDEGSLPTLTITPEVLGSMEEIFKEQTGATLKIEAPSTGEE